MPDDYKEIQLMIYNNIEKRANFFSGTKCESILNMQNLFSVNVSDLEFIITERHRCFKPRQL